MASVLEPSEEAAQVALRLMNRMLQWQPIHRAGWHIYHGSADPAQQALVRQQAAAGATIAEIPQPDPFFRRAAAGRSGPTGQGWVTGFEPATPDPHLEL
jgi:hypothetical protein